MSTTLFRGGKEVPLEDLCLSSETSMKELLDPASFKRRSQAMAKINALLGVRERSPKELRQRLVACGFSDEEAAQAVQRALDCGLVSQERYVLSFARGKLAKGWSRGKVVDALRSQGLSWEAIEACPELVDDDEREELFRALRELSRRKTYSKNPRQALVNRLLRKGYGYDLALKAVNQHLSPAGE